MHVRVDACVSVSIYACACVRSQRAARSAVRLRTPAFLSLAVGKHVGNARARARLTPAGRATSTPFRLRTWPGEPRSAGGGSGAGDLGSGLASPG
jgi:hypothetical protein